MRRGNHAVPSSSLANVSTQPRRWNTDQRDTASDVLRLWADDGPTPRTHPRSQRRQVSPSPPQIPGREHPVGEAGDAGTGLILLLSIEEVSRALSLGRSTIYELIGAGKLEVVHIGRAARVTVSSLEAFIRSLPRRPAADGGEPRAANG